MKKTIVLVAVSLVLALAAQPAAAYVTGFEPNEVPPDYTGSPTGTPTPLDPVQGDANPGQGGWISQWGNGLNVHKYAGNQVDFVPPWDVPPDYQVPVNPTGGEQFIADDPEGGASEVHPVTWGGLQEMSIDYYPGPQYDNSGNYNAAFLARDPGNNAGFYAGDGTSAPAGDPSPGPWAPHFIIFDAAGTQIKNEALGYVFRGQAGFDDLAMEEWRRIGIVIDWNTRKILQLKSQKLVVCNDAIVWDNPQAEVDDGQGGTELVDIFVSQTDPGEIKYVRLYDVGNGTLTAYDNVYVGQPYDWPHVVPEPATMSLLALGGLIALKRRRR